MTLSPALCMGCNLPSPGCKCHSPRSRTSCSTNYQDASGQSHHSGKEPRTDSRDSSERLRSVSWTEDKFPPPALAMARISHQDQLPASVSPGYRDLSGVVPLPSHVDTSVPPPPRPTVPPSASIQPHPPVVSSYQASLQSCKENLPLTFDNARMSASRKNRTRSPRTSISEINDWSAPQPVTHTQQGSIRPSLANTDTVFH